LELSPVIIGILGLVILLILIFLEMPVGIALIVVSFAGIWAIKDVSVALHLLGNVTYKTSVTYLWSLLPLFILMGQFALHGGLSADLFNAFFKWLGRRRGGLALATVGTSTAFGACCSDPLAASVTLTSVCLPEMRKYKYDDALSLASICVGALLSFLIPPSLGFIIYGILANVSISELFIAGVFPGILMAILYVVVIYIMCKINPRLGPVGPGVSWMERLKSLKRLWGVLLLIVIVFGGIYSGFISPTEAGALGAFAAFVIGIIKRKLNWKGFSTAILDTVASSGMIFLLLIGAWLFAPFLSYTRIPAMLINVVGAWSPNIVLLFVLAFFFLGGMIFDSVILMIITIPIFLPLWIVAGFDMVWFGVILIIIVVLGNITPPVGLVVYVVAGLVPEVPITRIFKSILPFIPAVLIAIGLVIAFPQIALFLPNLIK
jgi:tripartite ATP-independent transporter DctM subunit